jgi:hypothetical protein
VFWPGKLRRLLVMGIWEIIKFAALLVPNERNFAMVGDRNSEANSFGRVGTILQDNLNGDGIVDI